MDLEVKGRSASQVAQVVEATFAAAGIGRAFDEMLTAIEAEENLPIEQRQEMEKLTRALKNEAELPVDKRSKPAVIRSMLKSLSTLAGAGGSVAEVWEAWGKSIESFFGL